MYEQNLKDELFACFKYIGIPFDMLDKMPIRDRKYYIHKYNDYMEARKQAMDNATSKSSTNIGAYTNMSQGVTGDDVFDEM
jgi:hypothetical protein